MTVVEIELKQAGAIVVFQNVIFVKIIYSGNLKWDIQCSGGNVYIGRRIASGKSNGGAILDSTVTSIEKIIKISEDIENKFGKSVKLYTGEEAC